MTFELNRDQERAASTLDRDVVVTAGAGSGKTRMLAQRFINAVVPGRVNGWTPASVDDIVAITFTEKAAGELAERVRLTLRDGGFADQSRRVDGAWVSTIHGLCSRLLRRHAFQAGVDPLFEVADTVVAGRIRAEAFERAALSLIRVDSEVASLLDAYSYERVFEAVLVLTRELAVRGLNASGIELEPVLPAEALSQRAIDLFSDGRTACDDYTGTAKSPADYAAGCARLLDRALELQAAALDEHQTIAGLALIVAGYKPLRVVKGLEDVREDGEARGMPLKAQVGAALVAPYARGLRRLAEAFSAEFRALKKSVGVLDFDDLQVGAVELLARAPKVAREYRERFRLVMIDEFQDTDALQLKLVEALSHEDLCTVGDEKQSIYRFRGADIDVYRQHRAQMAERNALEVSLGVNYRSHPDVLAFVNAVFSADQYFAGDLLRLTPPEGARPPQTLDDVLADGARVEALFVDSSAVDTPAGRRAEASEIARRLAALRDAGVDPGDMVILVRAYSSAHVYAEALSAEGVSAIIVGGSRFFDLDEVAVMRALTRAIANPSDGAAVGALLASEFCPASDDALARLRLTPDGRDKRPLWTVLCENRAAFDGDDGEAVRRLIALVEGARREIGSRPLADILLQAVEAAGYDIRLLSRDNAGRDAFANVLKFARQAAAFEASEGTGPAGFSAYLDTKERLGDVEAPASVADDGSSAVRIMSVHASKGLEFPVVVVPDLASSGSGGSPMVRTEAIAGRLRIALKPPVTDDGEKLPESEWAAQFAETEREANDEERNRVLYVAFTRARDLLILSGSMNMRPKNPPTATHHLIRLAQLLGVSVPITGTCDVLATLSDCGTGEIATCRMRVLDAEEVLTRSVGGQAPGRREGCALPPATGPRFPDSRAEITPPETISYSALHVFEECQRRFLIENVLRLSKIAMLEPGEPDPTRFGSALHAVLQLVDGDGVLPDERRIAALGRQYELDVAQLERLRVAVERFTLSPIAARAVAHERVAREMPFALPIASGSCLLVGSIDVYSRSGSSALIVDYKSGASGTADEHVATYELQAKCYALAAFSDGCDAVEVVFVRPEVVVAGGGVQETVYRYRGEDEVQLRDAVEALYQEIVASPYEPLCARDESVCGYCAAPVGLCPNARS